MAIDRVSIRDYLAFKGEFEVGFCPGVNVIIGGNGTGKTTLLRETYYSVESSLHMDRSSSDIGLKQYEIGGLSRKEEYWGVFFSPHKVGRIIYIPEKDILEHARGLLPFIEQKATGFGQVYRDIIIAAQDVPTIIQSETQKSISQRIARIIDGEMCWNQTDGTFNTLKTDGTRIPFSNEASGFKKLGLLGLLVTSGQLDPECILLWDEPENSLNPELVPVLVDILLELSRDGVQIVIATHDYYLARYFDVRGDKAIPVLFHNLTKTDDGHIACNSSPEYINLPNNHLETASAELFKAVVRDAMEGQKDGYSLR